MSCSIELYELQLIRPSLHASHVYACISFSFCCHAVQLSDMVKARRETFLDSDDVGGVLITFAVLCGFEDILRANIL